MTDQKKFDQKLKEISDICDEEKYIFRGEEEYYEKISSNLYRKYGELVEGIENHPFSVVKIPFLLEMEKNIVDEAKSHFSPSVSNIEVLTDLQHYGGETALIDFTRNIYIALFFACHGSPDKDGRIILFDKSKTKEKKDVNYTNSKDDYEIIASTGKYPRVVFQSSLFVHAARGYIEPEKGEIIKIPKELKKDFLNYLRKHFHIERTTIYNDIHGFIQSQKELTEAKEELLSGLKHQMKGDIEEAIKDYDKAIELALDPQEAASYYLCRGAAKSYLGKQEEAIKDYDKAIELKPKEAITYNNRGIAKSSLGKHEEAIKDYDKTIELDPKNAEAYYYRGDTKFHLGKYAEAIEDCDKAIELDPKNAEACKRIRDQAKSDLATKKKQQL